MREDQLQNVITSQFINIFWFVLEASFCFEFRFFFYEMKVRSTTPPILTNRTTTSQYHRKPLNIKKVHDIWYWKC